jgi:predicted phosphate transport protein (TIGR00153 family)
MSIISKLFGKSPFEPLYLHMCKVKKCVDLIQPLMRAFIDEDFDKITEITKLIFKAEHEADLMKKEIRINLPKGIFLPVARGDILRFLKEQDNIADATEDLAALLAMRRMKIPTELKDELQNLVDEVIEAFNLTMKVSSEIKLLAETSFGGAEAHKVMEMIEEIKIKEWEADKAQMRAAQMMFSLEDQLDPVSVMMWMNIFRELGNLANHAENTGDQLRIMLHE